jgi:hypothetical protein
VRRGEAASDKMAATFLVPPGEILPPDISLIRRINSLNAQKNACSNSRLLRRSAAIAPHRAGR